MTTLKIREKVYEYINHADDRILKAVYAMLKEYDDTPASRSMLTDKQYEEIEKRWRNYKNGKSKIYTLSEAKQRIQGR